MNRMLILKILLGYVAVSHLSIGLAATVVPPGDFANFIIDVTYGGSFEIGPETHHVIRVLGAFMMTMGVMATFAVFNPHRNMAVVYAIAFLFIVRTLQRVIFAGDIQEHFDISHARLVGQSVFFLALGGAIYLIRPRHSAEA